MEYGKNKQKQIVLNSPLRVIIGGIFALIITMGIGRFAYTPILPLMKEAQHFSDGFAGFLASMNYLGYLIGSLITGVIRWRKRRQTAFQVFLVLSILSTGIMSTTTSLSLWSVFRFVSGMSSGMVFVLASSIVLDVLASQEKVSWSGYFYSGVGIGILITGLLVPVFHHFFSWRGTWFGLMVLSVITGIFSWIWTRENGSAQELEKSYSGKTNKYNIFFKFLLVSYGLEGMGYIVTGTFLVDVASEIPGLKEFASSSWVVVGFAAIPSSPLWVWIAKHWGTVRSLVVAYLIQGIGVVVPVLLFDPVGVYLSALLFGGTFMGITTLATSIAKILYSDGSSQSIGYLTAAYGAGQVLGPIGAGILTEKTHSYTLPLVMAAFILLLGAILLVTGKIIDRRKETTIPASQNSEVRS